MLDNIDYAFPAGDESDGSSDEWDIGHASCSKKLELKVKLYIYFFKNMLGLRAS